MKIVLHVTGVQIRRKVEVNKQQHLYYAMNTIQVMFLFIQKLFLRVEISSYGMMTTIQHLLKIFLGNS